MDSSGGRARGRSYCCSASSPGGATVGKIDAERGIEGVRGPDGETRTLRHPWSVLAFQLAGADGLRAIHGDGLDDERETPPAEPLLAGLLEVPRRRGLATLVLVDEVLMYAREKAGLDAVWRGRIVDFFQYLTQAVGKVDTAAMVASILATDPHKQRGELGSRLTSELVKRHSKLTPWRHRKLTPEETAYVAHNDDSVVCNLGR